MSVLPGDQQLDADLRQRLKQAIDQHVREQLAATDSIFRTGKCAGCGMGYDDNTPKCRACWDRHRNRRRTQACADCGQTITRSAKTGRCHPCVYKLLAKAKANA